MIILRADFLRGVYVAAEPNAPKTGEWPPAPARLFAALVASAYAIGVDPTPLTALELPPAIQYGPAIPAPGGIHYVPAAFLEKSGRTRVDTRRPQQVGIADPVFYAWETTLDAAWLTPILDAVTYLGRAESPVRLSVAETLPEMPHHLAPDPDGEELIRVPGEHWLAELQAHYARNARLVAPYVGYSDPRRRVAPSPWGELFALRPDSGELPEAAQLGEALRAATMSHAPAAMSAILHGHDQVPHAAWITLPNVAHDHADGRVLGVGMLLPRDLSDAERTEAVWALSRVDHLQAGRRIAVRRLASHEREPAGMRRGTWSALAETWASVTPIVLERHPRRGTGPDGVSEAIADSCERWGYPRPTAVEVSPYSPLRGVPRAQVFRPRRAGCWTHALLHWDRPVRGPVLLGRDQHFGLGLCRPWSTP